MPVVSLRDCRSHELPRYKEVDILGKVNEVVPGICIRDITPNISGWALHLIGDDDKQKLLMPSARKTLKDSHDIDILKPPDYRAACSIIVDDFEEICKNTGNLALGRIIESEIKIPLFITRLTPTSYRMEFDSPEEAKRIVRKAIIIDPPIFPSQMRLERYTKVPQCTRCFAFDHERSECTDGIYCFICGEEGHVDRECTNKENPKCKNCRGPHVAIAFRCPIRKAIKEELESGELPSISSEGATASSSHGTAMGATALEPGDGLTREEANLIAGDQIRRITSEVLEAYRPLFNQIPSESVSQSNSPSSDEDSQTCSDEEEEPRRVWPPARVLRAPDQNKGEGPCRPLRSLPPSDDDEFVPPEPSLPSFPVLPQRVLRCIVVGN